MDKIIHLGNVYNILTVILVNQPIRIEYYDTFYDNLSASWYKHRFSDKGDFYILSQLMIKCWIWKYIQLDLDGSEDGSSSVDDNDSSNSERM